jgi:hypothetical protein
MKKLGLLSLIIVLSLTFFGCQDELLDTWDETTLFNDGLLGVCNSADLCGYIDESFELVIDYSYQDVYDFMNGLARVKKDNKFGVINSENKVIIDIKYDQIVMYPEQYLILAIENDKQQYFNYFGNKISSSEYYTSIGYNDYTLFSFYDPTNHCYGYKDIDDEIAIECNIDNITEGTFKTVTVINNDDNYF